MKFISILVLIFAASSALAERPVCRADKFVEPITQLSGCANEGSMEFCLPKGNLALQTQLRAQYPGIRCFNGSQSTGHVNCETISEEVLCIYPIARTECATRVAMTDAGWDRFCRFSQLDVVERIAPTWIE